MGLAGFVSGYLQVNGNFEIQSGTCILKFGKKTLFLLFSVEQQFSHEWPTFTVSVKETKEIHDGAVCSTKVKTTWISMVGGSAKSLERFQSEFCLGQT